MALSHTNIRIPHLKKILGPPLPPALCDIWAYKGGLFSKVVLVFRNFGYDQGGIQISALCHPEIWDIISPETAWFQILNSDQINVIYQPYSAIFCFCNWKFVHVFISDMNWLERTWNDKMLVIWRGFFSYTICSCKWKDTVTWTLFMSQIYWSCYRNSVFCFDSNFHYFPFCDWNTIMKTTIWQGTSSCEKILILRTLILFQLHVLFPGIVLYLLCSMTSFPFLWQEICSVARISFLCQ